MIYVRADDQDDPHSEIHVQMKGTGNLIVHEAGALMNYIYENDPGMFHSITRSIIYQHREDFLRLVDDKNRKHV